MAEVRLFDPESPEEGTEIGAAPIPDLPPEPPDPDEPKPKRAAARRPARRKRRVLTRVRSIASSATRSSEPEPDLVASGEEPAREAEQPATEQEVVRAFWGAYRFWCRILDAPPEATAGDFQDLGEAWAGLMRKVSWFRLVMVFLTPALTMLEFLELLQRAFDKRRRYRRKEAKSPELTQEQQAEAWSAAEAIPGASGAG